MIVPALHFHGNCAEAHDLYQKAFDMTIDSVTYNREAPSDYFADEPLTDETRNLILHSECTICGTRVNMGDTGAEITGSSINLNVFLSSEDAVRKAFDVLKAGGKVDTELGPQFWSPMYCALQDRFGVHWQIMTE
jgi:PhnB protein